MVIDPNSTIEVGKLKLKNPYSLSSPDNNDVLCAFDASDGELSKTNLKVNDIANKTDLNNLKIAKDGSFISFDTSDGAIFRNKGYDSSLLFSIGQYARWLGRSGTQERTLVWGFWYGYHADKSQSNNYYKSNLCFF